MGLWEGYEPASFKADGEETIRFMARSIVETGGVTIAARRRPYRDGAKLDALGALEDKWDFEALFLSDEDAQEPGVTDDGGLPMYPDRLQALIDAFKTGKTGVFNLPWKRGLRAKCGSWTRRDVADEHRNGAVFAGQFIEDNEDSVDREAIVKPSARGALDRKVQEATFDAEASATWDSSLADWNGAVAELVGIMNTPGEYVGQLRTAVARLQGMVSMVRDAFSSPFEGRDQFRDPESIQMRLRLLEIEDLIALAEEQARSSEIKTRTYFPPTDTDIWAIAALLKQPAPTLVELNAADFDDLGYIEGGVGVRVLA